MSASSGSRPPRAAGRAAGTRAPDRRRSRGPASGRPSRAGRPARAAPRIDLPVVGAAVGEHEPERAAAAQQLVAVALEQPRRWPSPASRSRASAARSGIELDRDDGARRLGKRGGSFAERRPELGDVATGGEHAQQRLHLADRRAAAGHSSASGNERCRRGGTRKFWRCVVVSTELKPCARRARCRRRASCRRGARRPSRAGCARSRRSTG